MVKKPKHKNILAIKTMTMVNLCLVLFYVLLFNELFSPIFIDILNIYTRQKF